MADCVRCGLRGGAEFTHACVGTTTLGATPLVPIDIPSIMRASGFEEGVKAERARRGLSLRATREKTMAVRRKRRDTAPVEWTSAEVRAFHADKAMAAAINTEQSYPPGEYPGVVPEQRRNRRASLRATPEEPMAKEPK